MMKKILATVGLLAVMTFLGNNVVAPLSTAYADEFGTGLGATQQKTRSNMILSDGTSSEIALTPGETTTISLPVRAYKELISGPVFEAELSEDVPFTIKKVTAYRMLNNVKSEDNVYITGYEDAYVDVTIVTKETAKIGKYTFDLVYEEHKGDGTIQYDGDREYSQRLTLVGVISEEKLLPELAISDVKLSQPLKPGTTTEISFKLTNVGELLAKGVRVTASYDGENLLPDYFDYTKKLGDLKENESGRITLKVKVMPTASGNMVALPLDIDFKDVDGNAYKVTENNRLLLELQGDKKVDDPQATDGMILVSNVKQNPVQPKPGENVTLTFDVQNTGDLDYTEARLSAVYASNVGFEPINAEPYQYIGTIPAGGKKTVSITVKAGKNIASGLQTLTVNFDYLNGRKTATQDSAALYVLDVQEKEESLGKSKPKLMVSEFTTSVEQVKSGEEFDFIFKVFNTHSETAAKNIKVTVTSEMFSVTKGSNSFFLPQVEAGESEEITINLKASAAAMTGSYPLNILMEYEYDGMPTSEASVDGVTVTETKMLLIKENLRVTLEGMNVGNWNGVYAYQSTPLTFQVYNMGKSTLNNVYFTVEGDFMVANGSSYYYGTLQPGYPDFVEMEIMPNVIGDANGKLVIHMEDSNADEVTFEYDLYAYAMEMGGGSFDPGVIDPDIPADIDPVEKKEVKPIVSLPIYIAILVAILLVSLLVTRGIIIVRGKKKQRKEEQ